MQLNKELSIGFICITLFYTTCQHVQIAECTFPWLQSENLNILLIAWAVMCNTFNANMKNSNKTATKQDIGTIHRAKAWQSFYWYNCHTCGGPNILSWNSGATCGRMLSYKYFWHSHVSPGGFKTCGKIDDENSSKDILFNCFFTSSTYNVFR